MNCPNVTDPLGVGNEMLGYVDRKEELLELHVNRKGDMAVADNQIFSNMTGVNNSLDDWSLFEDYQPISLNMTDKWVYRFLDLAKYYAKWSLDPSTKVGAVLVRDGNVQLHQGYNGLPSNIPDSDDILNNRELKLDLVQHAEFNAIMGTLDKKDLDGAVILISAPPCMECSKLINAVHIREVIHLPPTPSFAERYAKDIVKVRDYFERVGIILTEVSRTQMTNLAADYAASII